ncbi:MULTISPECIES: group III truncated hemoglobin [Flavobacterium]|mgnify:FL=1|jgi:hemoglobin|uniref:group III truncated hemoglobin n=1 Tax=Flavobacterium TaxID=237 RepID=UPI000BB33276|nr:MULTISPECIES: group III truncated hemoglobin [Flavobacterium]MCM0664867.1 group III truncated hemoglobin [Flavobacterium tyrosinilyticum]MDY0987766.1 group III truncated hemoglobin [Flavobacterium sp. CFBP9031]PBI93461.1 Group 3 truncated hemoglobin ctb [Flavobacterium sp. ACN2]
MKKQIDNRADVSFLVHQFYAKIRADREIGFYFNEMISDWDAHLEKLTDFWETNLFGVRKYKGNPHAVHNEVDAHFDEKITTNEFGIWLNHWFQTIDEHFEGENAETLKRRARKMSTFLYMSMFQHRQKESEV